MNYLKDIKMGIFNKLFGKTPEPAVEAPVKAKKPRKPKTKKAPLSEKDKATSEGLPYVNVVRMDIDPDDINTGAFDLDFNDKFVINLIRAGYKNRDDDTDIVIVDRWFQTICKNIALELYEQKVADPENRNANDVRVVKSRDLGNGRTEVS